MKRSFECLTAAMALTLALTTGCSQKTAHSSRRSGGEAKQFSIKLNVGAKGFGLVRGNIQELGAQGTINCTEASSAVTFDAAGQGVVADDSVNGAEGCIVQLETLSAKILLPNGTDTVEVDYSAEEVEATAFAVGGVVGFTAPAGANAEVPPAVYLAITSQVDSAELSGEQLVAGEVYQSERLAGQSAGNLNVRSGFSLFRAAPLVFALPTINRNMNNEIESLTIALQCEQRKWTQYLPPSGMPIAGAGGYCGTGDYKIALSSSYENLPAESFPYYVALANTTEREVREALNGGADAKFLDESFMAARGGSLNDFLGAGTLKVTLAELGLDSLVEGDVVTFSLKDDNAKGNYATQSWEYNASGTFTAVDL